jgi:hypothetical protein
VDPQKTTGGKARETTEIQGQIRWLSPMSSRKPGETMTVRIRSGPAEVIAHGTVTAFAGNPLRMELSLPERLFVLDLGFRSEQGSSEPRVEGRPTPEGHAFELYNFDSAAGRGTALPVVLEELGEDALLLHFRVFLYGKTIDRTVHYTFYRVPKQALGWTAVVPDSDGG